jgi:hypothetical protein
MPAVVPDYGKSPERRPGLRARRVAGTAAARQRQIAQRVFRALVPAAWDVPG